MKWVQWLLVCSVSPVLFTTLNIFLFPVDHWLSCSHYVILHLLTAVIACYFARRYLSHFLAEDQPFANLTPALVKPATSPVKTLNDEVCVLAETIQEVYVRRWYDKLSSDAEFPEDVKEVLCEYFYSVTCKARRISKYTVIRKLLVAYHYHLQEYMRCVRIVKKRKKGGSLAACVQHVEEISSFYDGWEERNGSSSEENGKLYLSWFSHEMLKTMAPPDLQACDIVLVFVRGVLCHVVLKSLVRLMSDPLWVTKTIRKIFEPKEKKSNCQNANAANKNATCSSSGEVESQCKEYSECKNSMNDMKNVESMKRSSDVEKPQNTCLSMALGGILPAAAGLLCPENVHPSFSSNRRFFRSSSCEEFRSISPNEIMNSGTPITTEARILNGRDTSDTRTASPPQAKVGAKQVDITHFRRRFPAKSAGASISSSSSSRENSNDNITWPTSFAVPKRKLFQRSDSFEDSTDVFDAVPKKSIPKKLASLIGLKRKNLTDVTNPLKSLGEFPSLSLRTSEPTLNKDDSSEEKKEKTTPEYEDVPDIATAIEKLRNVLKEKSSSGSWSDGLDEATSFSRESSREGSQVKFADEIIPEVPVAVELDARPVIRINVPVTETCEDAVEGKYTKYYVEYDALCVEPSSPESIDDVSSGYEVRLCFVKRRFREFINLHMRLEGNPQLKNHLKGIRGPSRVRSIPFGRLDSNTVENRQQFLERYLQNLCTRPAIASSPELLQFLNHPQCCGFPQTEASPFNCKPTDVFVPRIDKFLAKKMTGVLNSLKTALPSFEPELGIGIGEGCVQKTSPGIIEGVPRNNNSSSRFMPNFLSFNPNRPNSLKLDSVVEKEGAIHLESQIERFLLNYGATGDAYEASEALAWEQGRRESDRAALYRGDTITDPAGDEELGIDSHLPFSSLILNLCCALVEKEDVWLTKEPLIHVLKLFYGFSLESKLKDMIEDLTSENSWIKYVRQLSETLKSEKSGETTAPTPEEVRVAIDNATKAILATLPDFLKITSEWDDVEEAMQLLVGSLLIPLGNTGLFYHLLTILMGELRLRR